jgi:hypothetical protein
MPPKSTALAEPSTVRAARECSWQALGAEDDHLRLAALIAADLREAGADPEAANVCLSAQSSWGSRREALKKLLNSALAKDRSVADIDALYQSPSDYQLWDDRQFQRERAELFDDLIEAGVRHAWVFRRPNPHSRVTARLRERDVAVPAEDGGLDPYLRPIIPELRAAARNLVAKGFAKPADLDSFAKSNGPRLLSHHVIRLADARVSVEGRDTALRLSLLRPAQPLNGSLGVLPLGGNSAHAIRREMVDELVEFGLLDRNGGFVQMPRSVRVFYSAVAEGTNDIDARSAHSWITRQLAAQDSIRAKTERHYHAIGSHDVEEAFASASYYATDTRFLGVWLSRMGRFNDANYLRAADVFARLLDIDVDDSYAWEYWAFNARWGSAPWTRTSPAVRDDIRQAFLKAWALEKLRAGHDAANPLYHGRWLGFRAECGEDVMPEFRAGIALYSRAPTKERAESSVSWFAKQVIIGVKENTDAAWRNQMMARLEAEFGVDQVAEWRTANRKQGRPDLE